MLSVSVVSTLTAPARSTAMHDPLRGRCCVPRVSNTLRSTVTKSSKSVSKGASVQLSKSVLNVTGAPRGVCEGVTVLDGVCEGVGVPVCVIADEGVGVINDVGERVRGAVGDAVRDAVVELEAVPVFDGVSVRVGDATMHTSTLSMNSVLSPRLSATLRTRKTRSCGAPAGTNTDTRVNWPLLVAA